MKFCKGTGVCLEVIGRLKEIPTIRTTKEEKTVAEINLAVDAKRMEDGKFLDETQWITVTVWGKAAELLNTYGKPGIRVYLNASVRMQKHKITDEGGDKSYFANIPKFYADAIDFLDPIYSNDQQKDAA